MLELYHNVTSTCSQKARLVLAQKALERTSHEIELFQSAGREVWPQLETLI
jgi:hypothetical protein